MTYIQTDGKYQSQLADLYNKYVLLATSNDPNGNGIPKTEIGRAIFTTYTMYYNFHLEDVKNIEKFEKLLKICPIPKDVINYKNFKDYYGKFDCCNMERMMDLVIECCMLKEQRTFDLNNFRWSISNLNIPNINYYLAYFNRTGYSKNDTRYITEGLVDYIKRHRYKTKKDIMKANEKQFMDVFILLSKQLNLNEIYTKKDKMTIEKNFPKVKEFFKTV